MAASFRNYIQILSIALVFTVITTVQPVVSVDPPEYSPSPSPQPSDDLSPSPDGPSISPSVMDFSPPAPPPTDSPSPSPAPAPAIGSDVNHSNQASYGNLEAHELSGGMNSGQKAGIALGVIAFLCVFGIGVVVYKKRQNNLRRAQFGYAARREFL